MKVLIFGSLILCLGIILVFITPTPKNCQDCIKTIPLILICAGVSIQVISVFQIRRESERKLQEKIDDLHRSY
ncbi:MAG: hypothetical protein LiPW41_678 [Parcubacteria group bacterium LiPW_41]|nr:MAG: hypothetical protein LiPW41_678 [Parcubacteria group bacterium LiPW_41]